MSEQPPQGSGPPPGDGAPPPAPTGPPPPPNPYYPQGLPGAGAIGAPIWRPDHPQSTTVLILGIVGIAICQVAAPIAWVLGRRAKQEIEASGGSLGGQSQVQIGYVLGIIGTCLLAAGVLLGIVYLVFVVVLVGAGAA